MYKKVKDTFDVNINFTVCGIMLGLNLYHDPLFYCINYLILTGKWYIKLKIAKRKLTLSNILSF